MKRNSLFLVVALMIGTMNAREPATSTHDGNMPLPQRHQAKAVMQHATKAHDVAIPGKSPARAGAAATRYRRPAGAFTGFEVIRNGKDIGGYNGPVLRVKPFTPYTYTALQQGSGHVSNPSLRGELINDNTYLPPMTDDNSDITIRYDLGWYDSSPLVYGDNSLNYIPVFSGESFANLYEEEEGYDLLMSSKTFVHTRVNQSSTTLMTYYSGCTPYDNNDYGWWFGKNGGRSNGIPVDGIAQVFEKPTSPYRLKQVALMVTELSVTAPVMMTCRVYRLHNGIPAYSDDACVMLDESLDDLIATGRVTLTPESEECILFDLYRETDGIEYIDQPVINDAIIVVVDGYNDPSMENLADFTACISAAKNTDEGFGELAYLKYGIPDENGNFSGRYSWVGLNNFFSSGEMKTGFTIFLTLDYPYLAFEFEEESGQYTFGEDGGPMEKRLELTDGTIITSQVISFYSSCEELEISCNGNEPPEWLDIDLAFCDGSDENGYWGHPCVIDAAVTAAPLPDGVNYRSATVRFAIPGDHVDYTFHQARGNNPSDFGDLNNDGEVNIADINLLIGYILNGGTGGDLNDDGETNIGDLNMLIGIILNKSN